jgi:hypothetical protein
MRFLDRRVYVADSHFSLAPSGEFAGIKNIATLVMPSANGRRCKFKSMSDRFDFLSQPGFLASSNPVIFTVT